MPLSSSTPPNLTPSLPRKVHGLEGAPGTQWLAPPTLPPPLTSAGDPRAPDVRPAAAGRGGHGACGGLRREGRGRAAESPPPSRGGEGREGRGDGRAGAVGPGQLHPHCDLGPPSCWGGGASPSWGRGARAGAAGSARERAGPGRRPHLHLGPRVGGRKAGSGGPAGFGFPASGFQSANDALGALQPEWAPRVSGSARGARFSRVHFCYLHSS